MALSACPAVACTSSTTRKKLTLSAYINAREYAGDTTGPSTLERVRYAAKLFRETGKPILVTGGIPGGIGARSEGEIMRDILQDEFHVPVRWVENQAQESKQNALLSAPLL